MTGNTITAGIAIDTWKLPIFERHLTQNGYVFEKGEILNDVLLLRVKTTNPTALAAVVLAANREAAMTKGAKP